MSDWKVVVSLEDVGSRKNFKDAVKVFVEKIEEKRSSLSLRILETGCWIKHSDEDQGPMMFPTIRDMACDLGWLVHGKFNF